mgnify:CR=1 FL=1
MDTLPKISLISKKKLNFSSFPLFSFIFLFFFFQNKVEKKKKIDEVIKEKVVLEEKRMTRSAKKNQKDEKSSKNIHMEEEKNDPFAFNVQSQGIITLFF